MGGAATLAAQSPMAKRDDSHQAIAAHHLPASRTSVFRLAVPLIYAGMGVALGTLTGVSLAFISASGGISESLNAMIPANSSTPDSAVDAGERAVWADNTAQPVKIQTADSGRTSISAADSISTNSATDKSAADRPAKDQNSPETQVSPTKTPAVKRDPVSPAAPEKNRQARPVIHPFAKPVRPVLASLPEVASEPQQDQQLSLVEGQQLNLNDAKSPHFFIEGDFTVADYDASEGTIETSDGRTFVIGDTVRVSNTASWDEYRSSVHYRCGENGSCTLTREGAITLNARLI
jgi:hypothetical protein